MSFSLQEIDNYLLLIIGPLLIISTIDKDPQTDIAILITSLIIYTFSIATLLRVKKYYSVFLMFCILIKDCILLIDRFNKTKTEIQKGD